MNQRISVIGLGLMGSALATTLLEGNFTVTVWNRTAEKAKAIVEAGASLAANVDEAINSSEIIVVCVGNYNDTKMLFSDCADLTGKTLIQLTTGTAAEAEAMHAWAESMKGLYLDGVIIAFPSEIGKEQTVLCVAGSEEAWQNGERAIKCLGGSSMYMGVSLAAPGALESALVLPTLMAMMGTIYGAHILEQTGLDVGAYAEMLADEGSSIADNLHRQAAAIAANRFTDTEAALGTWAASLNHKTDFPTGSIDLLEPIRELLNQAVAAGFGDEEIASVIKVLRRASQTT